MNIICELNRDITNRFKVMDDEKHQEDCQEHARKVCIIESYKEEIKEILYLSSGCVGIDTYSFKEYGLGLNPEYIDLKNFIDKIHQFKSHNLNFQYVKSKYSFYGSFVTQQDEDKYSLSFLCKSENREYVERFLHIVNQYSKEFFNKEYFLRWQGSFCDSHLVLVHTDETWFNEYRRKSDVIDDWWLLLFGIILPLVGWLMVIYSAYQLFLSYKDRKEI